MPYCPPVHHLSSDDSSMTLEVEERNDGCEILLGEEWQWPFTEYYRVHQLMCAASQLVASR